MGMRTWPSSTRTGSFFQQLAGAKAREAGTGEDVELRGMGVVDDMTSICREEPLLAGNVWEVCEPGSLARGIQVTSHGSNSEAPGASVRFTTS